MIMATSVSGQMLAIDCFGVSEPLRTSPWDVLNASTNGLDAHGLTEYAAVFIVENIQIQSESTL